MRQPFDIEDPEDNASSRKSSKKSARSSLFAWQASQKGNSSLPIKTVLGAFVLCVVFVVVYFVFLRGGNGVRRIIKMDTPHGHEFDYRNLELTNGLKVLLGSNEEEDLTYITLCVGAGVLDEKPKHVGLANVVASTLLASRMERASKENKQLSELQSEVQVNVYQETSCFSAVLPDEKLMPVLLDRFADMMIDPKFEKDVLQQRLEDDFTFEPSIKDIESIAVLSEDVNLDHPLHYTARVKSRFDSQKFKGTLEELQQAATAFFKDNYVPNDMSLVIAGPLTLDEFQGLATSSFGKIPASASGKDKSMKCGDPAKYGDMTATRWEGFVTICDPQFFFPESAAGELSFSWRIPEWHAGEFWSKKPWSYAKWALSWEGPGSILSQLQRKGWALALNAGVEIGLGLYGDEAAALEMFNVRVLLTKDGASNIQGIGEIVFAYMQLLRDNQQDWVMEEQKRKGEMIAYFMRGAFEEEAFAKNALKYPPEYVITGPFVILEIDMPAALKVLSHLAMDKCRVEFSSNDEEVAKGLSKDIEVLREGGEWVPIKYDHKEIDASMLAAWKEASNGKFMEGALNLPPPNPFIFDRTSLQMVQIDNPSSQPQLLTGADMPRIYHQAYTEHGDFSFYIAITVYSKALGGDAKNFQRWQLWCRAQEQLEEEEFYDARVLEELRFGYNVRRGALEIRIQTVSPVADIALKKLAKILIEPAVVPTTIKESQIAMLKWSLENSPPLSLAERKQIEATHSWTLPWTDQLRNLEEFTEEDLTLDPKKLFESCFVEALVVGNVLPDETKRYVEVFTSAVHATQGEGDKKIQTITPRMQEAILLEMPSLQKVDGVKKDVKNHTIFAYLQVQGAKAPENAAFFSLLCKFLARQENKLLSTWSRIQGWTCPDRVITSEVVGFKFSLDTSSPPDQMLQLTHHELKAAVERAVKCDAETFDQLKTNAERENKKSQPFAFLGKAFAYRENEFKKRRLSFDTLQQLDSGIQALDVNKFHEMVEQLKKRWFYVIVKKTDTGEDAPEISKEAMKKAGIEELSDVEFETFDRDAFRSSAEWKDIWEHDLTKPAPT